MLVITFASIGMTVVSGFISAKASAATSALGRPQSRRRKQDTAGEVGFFDLVKVNDIDRPDPHQRQVLQHFVTKRTGTDHQHLGGGQFFLLPPGDEPQATVTVFVIDEEGFLCHF